MIVSRLTSQDLSQVALDFEPLFPWHAPGAVLRQLLDALDPSRQQHVHVVRERSGRVVAMGAFGKAHASSRYVWQLYMTAVLPDYRGQGLHDVLVKSRLAAIEMLANAPTFVLVSTRRVDFFKAFGFVPIDESLPETILILKHIAAPQAQKDLSHAQKF